MPLDSVHFLNYYRNMKVFDSVIVGGGPAGLSAAIYLARFNRSVLVVERRDGRTINPQINENYLGFPKGIGAKKLTALGREQAKRFGVKFEIDEIMNAKKNVGRFSLRGKKGSYFGKTVILCTGVRDLYPSFPGLEKYVGKSLFWCIICDGHKVRNKKLVIIGHDDEATVTAAQFLNFTNKITFLTNCDEKCDHISKKGFARLKKAKIPVVYGSIKKVHGIRGMMDKVELDNGKKIPADFMFNKQGYAANSDMGSCLGVVLEGEGFIKTDHEQRTNIPRVYAAGDVTNEAAHQIVTAAHQGSIAAVSANEDLLLPFQKQEK